MCFRDAALITHNPDHSNQDKIWIVYRALLFLTLILQSISALASTYIEAGTGINSFSQAGSFFNSTAANSASGGFGGSLNIYTPLTRIQNFAHVEAGIQNRLNMGSVSSTGQSLTMASVHLGVRLEIWRLYTGAAYSPWMMAASPGGGLMGLRTRQDASAYLLEGGIIWRVIPELQIAAGVNYEYASVSGSGSPSPVTEYGLRFRFPLNPKESGSKGAVDFDGFRYPFGIMK